MKKLLITTMAAVSVGLCAKAADDGFISGTSFETLTAGVQLNAGYDDNGTDAGEKFWTSEASGDDLFTVTNIIYYTGSNTYPSDNRPAKWSGVANSNALAIDTANPILRNVNPKDGETGENTAQNVSTKPVFFDSVVQFTATDVAPSLEGNTTDKLMVWLYSSPDDVATTPGLFGETSPITRVAVTAGYSSDGVNLVTKNYLTNIEVEPDTWHRLTIKSFNDSDDGDLLFNIWVDKTQVSGKETIEAQETTTDFLSRIPDSVGDTFNKLQGVAFDGKGAVDDIVFTTKDPLYVPSATYAIVATYNNALVSFSTDEGGEEPLEDVSALPLTTTTVYGYVIVDEGYEVTAAKFNDSDLVVPAIDIYRGYNFLLPIGTPTNGDRYAFVVTVTKKAEGGANPTIGGVEVVVDDNGKITNITTANNGQVVSGEITDAMFADYYAVSVVDGKLVIAIDPAVATPQINATSDDADDAIVVTETAVALGVTNAKVGLWYGVQAYSDAACTTKIGDEPTGWEQAEGETVTVTVVKPDAGTAFFKVVVDDQDHTPAEEQN